MRPKTIIGGALIRTDQGVFSDGIDSSTEYYTKNRSRRHFQRTPLSSLEGTR
jgi:hypothetical protein